MANLRDLKIVDCDFVCDNDGIPVFIEGKEVVIQDVRHRLMESGVLVKFVGMKTPALYNYFLNRVVNVVEQDENVIPGTCTITTDNGKMNIRFRTYEFGELSL